MLSDPLVIPNDVQPLNLPRASARMRGRVGQMVGRSTYRTPEGDYACEIKRFLTGDDSSRIEILFTRTHSDANPFDGGVATVRNSFGFVLEVNDFQYNTLTDISYLREICDTFVDATMIDRLLAGES